MIKEELENVSSDDDDINFALVEERSEGDGDSSNSDSLITSSDSSLHDTNYETVVSEVSRKVGLSRFFHIRHQIADEEKIALREKRKKERRFKGVKRFFFGKKGKKLLKRKSTGSIHSEQY